MQDLYNAPTVEHWRAEEVIVSLLEKTHGT